MRAPPTPPNPHPCPCSNHPQVLPDSLLDALVKASEATHRAIQDGAGRCLVELLLPEFWDPNSGAVFAEEGDQQRFWKLTRRFADELSACAGGPRIKVIYPDAGVAAMLRNQWPDRAFDIAALGDPRVLADGDDVIVLAAPDPQTLKDSVEVAEATLAAGKPLVMFNPRLVSGDVGIGLNVRRLRDDFLSTFATTYSLRPIGDVGTVFRQYPGQWMVFVEDAAAPGRYRLVAERPSAPAGEALDLILEQALGTAGRVGEGEPSEPGLAAQVGGVMRGLQRFMRQLSQ